MDPSETPAWTGYSCEDFSKARSCLLLRKVEIRPNISTEIPLRLKFVKKTSLRRTVRVALDLSKALAILSDATVRRSAVDQEDLTP